MSIQSVLGFAGAWLALDAGYLALAWPPRAEEVAAGAIISGLAAALLARSARHAKLNFRVPPVRIARLMLRLPPRALADCALLLRTLTRRSIHGEIRAVPFLREVERRREESAGRRALVVAAVSVAPNTVVVAIDAGRDLLLVHQLVHTPQPPGGGDPVWPI